MAIDFFTSELHKVQDRFNQTFGKMIVCNINTRQRIMLAIISLGLLERKIMEAQNKDLVRTEIQRFIRGRNVLNRHFDEVERRMQDVEHTRKRKVGENSRVVRDRARTVAG